MCGIGGKEEWESLNIERLVRFSKKMYTGYCNKVLANTADTLSLKSKFYESRGHIWPASAVFPVPSTVLAHSK